jgi:hypothetical protein
VLKKKVNKKGEIYKKSIIKERAGVKWKGAGPQPLIHLAGIIAGLCYSVEPEESRTPIRN